MSGKTIYLEGNERLVFTRVLVDPTYLPHSEADDLDIYILHGLMHALMYPNQEIVLDLSHCRADRNTYFNLDRRIERLLQAMGIRNCYVRVHGNYLVMRAAGRRGFNNPHPDNLTKVLPPWPIPNSTP